jgi:glycosyltransferase involved in cell wall biosynthesis
LKIAFLGYQTNFKGYDVFNSLAESLLIRNKYLFYSFGNNPKNNRFNNIINIDLGFKREIDAQITTILLNNTIDIVILWSLLPESYSYTLHEAYSAGIPVITNTISGNIYESVANGTIYGKVFFSDYELLQFLSDDYKVLNFINKNKPIIRIMRHNSAFIKLISGNNL